ncbi:hypothetical protein F5883DRAFT_530796 [Diaporthe sp. PMI_573]|nr:hypothetical protein F5883DRAFT_530796 [Diaporthaceae sp. PMI_573]
MVSLAEFYTSIARFETFMSNEDFIDDGYDCRTLRVHRDGALPARVLPPHHAGADGRQVLGIELLPMRGPYPIVHGEYTLVFLREPDHGRLRIGMATLPRRGSSSCWIPRPSPSRPGDEKAALAWRRGVGRLPRWTGPTEDEEEKKPVVEEKKKKEAQDDVSPKYRYNRELAPLKVEALETMLAGAALLRANKRKIQRKIWAVEKAREKKEEEEKEREKRERERRAAEEEEHKAKEEVKEEAKEEVKPEEVEVKIEDIKDDPQ